MSLVLDAGYRPEPEITGNFNSIWRKKDMKKILVVAMCAAMMFSLSACGGTKKAESTAAAAESKVEAAASKVESAVEDAASKAESAVEDAASAVADAASAAASAVESAAK